MGIRSRRVDRGWRALVATWCCVSALAAGTASAAETAAVDELDLAQLRHIQGRADDADTLLSLTQEGALLYGQDSVKMDGYQYCSQAVALAEQGEFRQSVRAASKALHLAEASKDPELMARALRDLAIVFSYSGQLEQAEKFARAALAQPVKEAEQVVGPAHKVLGDVQGRRKDHAAAVRHYEAALQASSVRYAPLVRASLANALIEAGDTARAQTVLAQIEPPQDSRLESQLQRTRARLLLAQGDAAQARELYLDLAQQHAGMDAGYYRVWAWEGVARSETALGNTRAAADALSHALSSIDGVRAKFRSDEYKMGLFSDVQDIFEQAVALRLQLGDGERAFEASEHGRSRALLDAVRERAALDKDAARAVDLAALQSTLRADERVVQFHVLPDALLVWVVGPDSVKMHQIALGREALSRVVEAFRDGITAGRGSVIQAADQLGMLLLAPLGLEKGQRLIIVPHDSLHYLPFQALRLDGQYLIQRHPIAVAPSSSIAARLAGRSPRLSPNLVAFGNPRIADEYDLPGAEKEVLYLSELFPRHELFVGQAATKTAFAEAAKRAPVVHVAAHALAATDPSAFDLALIDLGMPGAEGILHVRQLRERCPGLPIIVLSGSADTALMRETLDCGAMGFIPKTYSSEVMLLAVKLVLAGGVYVPPALLAPAASAPGLRPGGAGLSMDSVRQVLTARQVEVLGLLSQGKPNKLIGRSLGISEGTVKIHLAAIFRALNARNRTEAVVVAQHLMMQEGAAGPALGDQH